MVEKIITENIGFLHLSDSNFTFPEIQKHLDSGYMIKAIYFTPLSVSSSVKGVSVTVHLIMQGASN